MYTKSNFQIAKLAAKDSSRFTLAGIYITPVETVVTDGKRLTRVKAAERGGDFAPFLMSAAQAIDAAKHAGKGTATFAPDTHSNGHVTVQAGAVTLTADKPVGSFPDYQRVIPSLDDTWQRITFDPKLMKEILDLHAAGGPAVTMYMKNNGSAIVLETTGGAQDMQSLLMPMRAEKVKRY
jgi:DNA polymerase III sliding clamp (beta) subunit (PCNA family)